MRYGFWQDDYETRLFVKHANRCVMHLISICRCKKKQKKKALTGLSSVICCFDSDIIQHNNVRLITMEPFFRLFLRITLTMQDKEEIMVPIEKMVELLGYYTLFSIVWVWTSNQSLCFICHCEALNISKREYRERLFLIKKNKKQSWTKSSCRFSICCV